MNKHRFRLIFSPSLGFLIPVAETARAQRKPGQTAGPSAPSSVTSLPSLKRLALSVFLAGLPAWATADILVDPNRPSGTTVISAANGVPVIEIANPNDKGLSHNRFTEFDVQKPGLIFNNSLVNGQSQIGGVLLRNPTLQRTATAILSEVTGNKPSSISGTLEVFGGKADLLIANTPASTQMANKLLEKHPENTVVFTDSAIGLTYKDGTHEIESPVDYASKRSKLNVLTPPGQPHPPKNLLRADIERRFGHDLGNLRMKVITVPNEVAPNSSATQQEPLPAPVPPPRKHRAALKADADAVGKTAPVQQTDTADSLPLPVAPPRKHRAAPKGDADAVGKTQPLQQAEATDSPPPPVAPPRKKRGARAQGDADAVGKKDPALQTDSTAAPTVIRADQPVRPARPGYKAPADSPPPLPNRTPVGRFHEASEASTPRPVNAAPALGFDTVKTKADIDALLGRSVPMAPALGNESVIEEAQARGEINTETGSFLKQAKLEISKQLETGPVLLGERHEKPDASLLLRDLIAEGKVAQLMIEMPSLTNVLKPVPGYQAVADQLEQHGYTSAEDYLNRSLKPDGTRDHPKLLRAVLHKVDGLRSSSDIKKPFHWNSLFSDAAQSGTKLHFIDMPFNGDESRFDGAGMHRRNKYMAEQIKNNPDLNGPGAVGLLGAEHIKRLLKDATIKEGVHGLANIDELQTYNLSPAFEDWEKKQSYPRWEELNRSAAQDVRPRESVYPPFKVDKISGPSELTGAPKYIQATHKNRIIVDRANTPESLQLANTLLAKHPDNTILFTQTGDSIDYRKGNHVNDPLADYFGQNTLFHLLVNNDQPKPANARPLQKEIREILRRKFGHEMSYVIPRIHTVDSDTSAQRSTRQQLPRGPVLLGENHALPDTMPLMRERDAAGESRPIMHGAPTTPAAAQPPIRPARPSRQVPVDMSPPLPAREPLGYSSTSAPQAPPGRAPTADLLRYNPVANSVGFDTPHGGSEPQGAGAMAPARPSADFTSLIDQALAQRKIGSEKSIFLKQAKQEISKQLEAGPVLLGESHSDPDAPLVMRELIAEGKVTHLMLELPALTTVLQGQPGYRAVDNQLQKYGYTSAEDYLNRSINPDGSREHNDVLEPLLNVVNTLRSSSDTTQPHPWNSTITDAAQRGIKLHFIDKPYDGTEQNVNVSTVHSRNKYMAGQIKNNPELNGPGVLGIFGSEHIRKMLKGTGVKEGVHRLANINELQTFDLENAFYDSEIKEGFPRWEELNRHVSQQVTPRKSVHPAFQLDRESSARKGRPKYIEADYKNRIVLDRSNTPESMKMANKLLEKYPENTILFSQFADSILYNKGNSTTEDKAGYSGQQTKVHLLVDSDQVSATRSPQLGAHVKEIIKRKFGHDMSALMLKVEAVNSNPAQRSANQQVATDTLPRSFRGAERTGENRVAAVPLLATPTGDKDGSPTEARPPEPADTAPNTLSPVAAATPIKGKFEDTPKTLIDLAQADGMIDAEGGKFLTLAKQEISTQLESGPVLLGEYHTMPDAPLLLRQLIAEGRITQVMLELPSLQRGLKNIPGYAAVQDSLEKRGYASAEDYLNNSIKPDGSRADVELLDPLLQSVGQLNSSFERATPHPWNAIISDAAKKSIKVHFIDTAIAGPGTATKMHTRNLLMAEKIKNNPELTAPGAIGVFGAGHIWSILEGSTVKGGLHHLANIDEQRTYDLSPAFYDVSAGKVFPRWPELNRHLAPQVTPRRSTTYAFELDKTSAPSAPRYVEPKYKNRIILDQVNTPESMKLATRLVDKHPENTVAFSEAGGLITYKEGNNTLEHQGAYTSKNTKFVMLSNPNNLLDIHDPALKPLINSQLKQFISEKFGHGMGNLRLKVIPMPDATPVQNTTAKKAP